MQGEVNYFPQQCGFLQSDQAIWNNYQNNDDISTDSIFNDIFGNSNDFLNVSSSGELLSDSTFSLLEDDEKVLALDTPETETSSTSQESVFTELSSCQFSFSTSSSISISSTPCEQSLAPASTSCHYVERLSFPSYTSSVNSSDVSLYPSDTDSGIHSPNVTRPTPSDAFTWRKEFNSFDIDSFYNSPRKSNADDKMECSSSPSSESEPKLLNLDDQPTYNAVPLTAVFSRQTTLPSIADLGVFGETVTSETSLHEEIWKAPNNCNRDSQLQPSKKHTFKVSPRIISADTSEKLKKVQKRRVANKRSRKLSDKGKSNPHLWEFIRDILLDPKYTPSLIKWEDRETGMFRFVQSDKVASMWGEEKRNSNMTYEKLSRAMRYYYERGILERVDGRRLVYKFGPNAYGWQKSTEVNFEVNHTNESDVKSCIPTKRTYSPGIIKPEDFSSLTVLTRNRNNDSNENYKRTNKASSISLPSANVLLGRSVRLTTV